MTAGFVRDRVSPQSGQQGAYDLIPQDAPAAEYDPVSAESEQDADAPPSTIDAALDQLILQRLDDDKAQDVVHIDLKGKSSVADALVIASGRSQRHVGAMADHLLRALKDAGHGRARVEGLPAADWVLIDAGDVIVHLFRPEVRAFYNIEKIWSVDTPGHITAAAV